MATKVKPSRLQVSWTPQVWQVPVYVNADTFQWWAWWGWVVSDTAYWASWDWDTTHAPSKNAVYDKISSVDTAVGTNTSAISTINWKIPSAATTSNKLADKNYVDDSINSVTAYYITKNAQGDQWATRAELFAATTFYSGWVVRVPTKNDYTIVLSDEQHDNAITRYIYNSGWEYQYTVNETALTQAQLDALNSWITAAKVTQYDWYVYDIAEKQDELVSGTNIRTINWTSILWSWDITTPVWPTYTAGSNVQISAENVISATDTKYTAMSQSEAASWITATPHTISASILRWAIRIHSKVQSVNWNEWAVTVSEFNPWWTATTGYVVTKTADWYEWAAPSGWIEVDENSPIQLTKIRAWSQSDYDNLWTYDSTCVYLTI